MHFKCETLDAMLARVFRCILPVRNDFFFPLPVLHLGVLGRPAIGDPVRLSVLRSATRAAGKADDHFYIQDFSEENGLAERIDIFLRVLGIGMNGIAVAAPEIGSSEFAACASISPPGTAAASKPLVAAKNSRRPMAEFSDCFFMRLLDERSSGVSTNVSAALYVNVRRKQALKIVFLKGSDRRGEPAKNTLTLDYTPGCRFCRGARAMQIGMVAKRIGLSV